MICMHKILDFVDICTSSWIQRPSALRFIFNWLFSFYKCLNPRVVAWATYVAQPYSFYWCKFRHLLVAIVATWSFATYVGGPKLSLRGKLQHVCAKNLQCTFQASCIVIRNRKLTCEESICLHSIWITQFFVFVYSKFIIFFYFSVFKTNLIWDLSLNIL